MKRPQEDNILAQWAADQLKAQAPGFYDEGAGKLVPRYEECLPRSVDYVEK